MKKVDVLPTKDEIFNAEYPPKILLKTNVERKCCDKCDGLGYEVKEILICYRKDDYDYKNVVCSKCTGVGAMEISTITMHIDRDDVYVMEKPFDRDKMLSDIANGQS